MATDYLVAKWKLWFKSLDVVHHGCLSDEDVEASIHNHVDINHLEGQDAESAKNTIKTWWKTYIFRGRTEKISEDEFVASLRRDYEADAVAFRAGLETGFYMIYDVFDLKHDHTLTEKESLNLFRAFGHHNAAQDKALFQKFDPGDGRARVSDGVNAMLVFTCNADDTEPDPVKEAFEAGA